MQIRSLAFRQAVASFALALGAALQAGPAIAQEIPPQQVLDRVFAYNTGSVLNMAFGNATRPPDFTDLGVTAGFLTACTLTSVNGLYCLDGRTLVRWPNPLEPGVSENVLSCTDPALGIENTLLLTCTGMTVDKAGVIWLAGKKKVPNSWPLKVWSNPYVVVKVTKKGSSCPDQEVIGGKYCATEAYTGKYLVTQLSPVDGDAAKSFRPCPNSCNPQAGVLAIEDLKSVIFFPSAVGQPSIPIPGQPNGGLKFGEILDDVSFLVLNGVGYVVATTNSGHVLAKNPATGGASSKVFHIPSERAPGSKKCSVVPSHYAIRGAASSTIVFVSDGQYCQVSALVPNAGFTQLANLPMPGGTGDFTLITKDPPGYHADTFPTFGLTVAPGIGVNLSGCKLNCSIVNSAAGTPAALLVEVKVVDDHKSGATVFQLKNLPDCRYAADLQNFPAAKRTFCASKSPGVVVNPDGTLPVINPLNGSMTPYFPPAAQSLNAIPLLPEDVTSAFDGTNVPPGGLPTQLLISRQYRGQKENQYQFGALFVIPGSGVKYKGVFGSEYDVLALQGKPSLPIGQPDPRCVVLTPNPQIADLLAWNVTTAVSETFISANGKYIDSLANVGCGSVKGSYGRLSLLPYDLELTPDTFAPTAKWPFTTKLTTENDAVFGRLVDSLINDLDYVFKELACKPVDSATVPLPPIVCGPNSAVREHLSWLRYKFDRCMIGAFTNKQVDAWLPPLLRNRPYCELALARLDQLHLALPDPDKHDHLTPVPLDYVQANDVANRLGELHSRIAVLRHVYTTRFQPSIPDKGFCKELGVCSYYY